MANEFGVSEEEISLELDRMMRQPEITVLGIGNVVLRDEGFGVRVVEYLDRHYDFPENVQLIDGGTLGVELMQFVTGTKRLLVIDSINGGAEGGKVFRFQGEAIMEHFQDKLSAHEVGIQDVLASLAVTGKRIEDVVVIGAQPYDLSAGVELSCEMERLLAPMADKALEELARWGVVPVHKAEAGEQDLSVVAEEEVRRQR